MSEREELELEKLRLEIELLKLGGPQPKQQESGGLVVPLAIIAAVIWLMMLMSTAHGADFVVENKVPQQQAVTKFTVTNLVTATPQPAQRREVAAPPTFRSGAYHAGHDCPKCGYTSPPRSGTWVVRGTNPDGTHTHQCPIDGTVWRH